MDVAALFAPAKAESSSGGEEALLKAARTGDLEALRRASASVGIKMDCCGSWDGMTALHWAAEKNNCPCASALLDAGSSVDARDSNKWTPLMAAVTKDNRDVAALLLKRGAALKLQVKGRPLVWSDLAISDEMLLMLGVASSGSSSSGEAAVEADGEAAPPSSRTRAARKRRR